MKNNECHRNLTARIGGTLLLLCALAISAAAQEAPTSTESLARLLMGNERFVAGKSTLKDFLAERPKLTQEQHPYAIVLACADSRVPPELLFDESLGRLFVVRTAGHVVDPIALGSIEYAVEHLHVNLLFVLGHESCGAVKATIGGGEASPNIAALARRIKPAVDKAYAHGVPEKDLLHVAVRENVRYQLQDAMFESEVLSESVFNKHLAVVGGVYDLQTGHVELVVTDVAVSHLDTHLAKGANPKQPAETEHAAPKHIVPPAPPATPDQTAPSDAPQVEKHKDTHGAPPPAKARFADKIRLAYENKNNLMVKRTTLMRDEKDSCATENCRSIAAGERVSLENPVILSVMGRPQLKVRYQGRPCYILADPDTIEVLVR
jgi:carbonic anhydrase